MNIRQMLFSRQVGALHITFGGSSEIGILKNVGSLSVGVSLSGRELRRYKEFLHVFTKHGGRVVQQTPEVTIQGRARRVVLLKFPNRPQLLRALLELKRCTNPAKFLVGPSDPTIIWTRANVEEAST